MIQADYQGQRYRLEDNLLEHFPEQIAAVNERVAGIEKNITLYAVHKEKTVGLEPSLTGGTVTASAKFPGMTIDGVEYAEKEPAAKALLEACNPVLIVGCVPQNPNTIAKYMESLNLTAKQYKTLDKLRSLVNAESC